MFHCFLSASLAYPITADQQPATGRPVTAERLRAIAERLPEACYFEELTTTLWVRADKKEDALQLLDEEPPP